jgi:glucokinase
MAVIGVDLGGTKIASGIFEHGGKLVTRRTAKLTDGGDAVGDLIISEVRSLLAETTVQPDALGVSVPGIFYSDRGTVWAPNITGWTDYPLVERLENGLGGNVSVRVDSDRACYVMGEEWQGRARGCRNVIFVAVGTGIGAGILIDGRVLRGAGDAAGAIGWMGLDRPYRDVYDDCGCFEYHASGSGIAKVARELLKSENTYDGVLSQKPAEDLTAVDVLIAEADGDPIAIEVMDDCIEFWGMAVANLVSLFNPEMIILGGGVFESAARFTPRIRAEATKWAQPISIGQVKIETSALGADAGLYGAARLALSETS